MNNGNYITFPYAVSSPSGIGSKGSSGGGSTNPPNIGIAGTDASGVIINSIILFGDETQDNITQFGQSNTNGGTNACTVLGGHNQTGPGYYYFVCGSDNIFPLVATANESHWEGNNNRAGSGSTVDCSHFEGQSNQIGLNNTAYDLHMEGVGTTIGDGNTITASHWEGSSNGLGSTGSVYGSHIQGENNTIGNNALGRGADIGGIANTIGNAVSFDNLSLMGGSNTIADSCTVTASHIEGTGNALGLGVGFSSGHIEGGPNTIIAGSISVAAHLEGENNHVGNVNSTAWHIEGSGHVVNDLSSIAVCHIEGQNHVVMASATGQAYHLEGSGNTIENVADCSFSHAEGSNNKIYSQNEHVEGTGNLVAGLAAHSEGNNNASNGDYSHSEGNGGQANGTGSHSQGGACIASGDYSHAGGNTSTASGLQSFSQGTSNVSSGDYSTTIGIGNQATATRSTAIGSVNVSSGADSVSMGSTCLSSGQSAISLGDGNSSMGNYSTTFGVANYAHYGQTVLGSYAINDAISDIVATPGQKIFKLGWGTLPTPKDVFSVYDDGSVESASFLKPLGIFNPSAPISEGILKGTDGDLIYVNNSQPIFNGDKLWQWNYSQAASYPYGSLVFAGTTETTLLDNTTPGRNGIFPIIKPGTFSNQRTFKFECGCGFNSGWASQATAPTLDINLYLGTVLALTWHIDFSTIAGINLGDNIPMFLDGWLNCVGNNTTPTALQFRAHNRIRVSMSSAPTTTNSDYGHETETYSTIDATSDVDVKITAKWSTGYNLFLDYFKISA